jgi:hypothetical protein
LLDDWGQEDFYGGREGDPCKIRGREKKTGLTSNSIAGKTQEEEGEEERKRKKDEGEEKSHGKINGT